MVIWLGPDTSGVGVQNAILRAGEVQSAMAASELHQKIRQQRDAWLLDARTQAEELMSAALAQAEAHVAEARRQAQSLLDEARSEIAASMRRGYEEGHRNAVLEWHERTAREREERNGAVRAMHGRLADVVTTAVERIVHTEQREGLYQRALRSVQSLTRGVSSLVLRVSSVDYEQASAALASDPPRPDGLSVQVEVDASLGPGSCVFESELGILDASLEVQLEGLRAAMNRALHKVLTEEDDDGDAPFSRYGLSQGETGHG